MLSLSPAKSIIVAGPWSYRELKKRPTVVSLFERAYTWLIAGLRMVGALFIVGVMFILTTGIHLPSFPWNSQKTQAVVQQEPAKSKVLGAAATDTCLARRSEPTTLFARCASFAVDYTNQRNGLMDNQAFTAYIGEPVANHEAQYYTASPKNLRVQDGSLVLEAHNDPLQGYRYTSARIDTKGKEEFLYGRLVVRAMLPTSVGTWPAIWLLPSDPRYASLSPASDTTRYLNDGEIDIAEAIGTEPHTVYGVVHSLSYSEDGVNREHFDTILLPDNDTTYHDYSVDWTPTSLTISVDDQPYFTYTKRPDADWRSWPFDQPFYLVINLALGGSWGGSDRTNFPIDGVDSDKLPAALKVQSIRYYAYVGPR